MDEIAKSTADAAAGSPNVATVVTADMPKNSSSSSGAAKSGNGKSTYQPSKVDLEPFTSPLTDEDKRMVDETIEELLKARACNRAHEVDVRLNFKAIYRICLRAEELFTNEPGLLKLKAPINIVGDIHGQFLDLLRYFEIGGLPPNSQYLFLGDYVDRGKHGVETTMLLLAYKLKYPNRIFMLKGNHECATISRLYGFWDECTQKYDEASWRAMNSVFRALPLAALINDRIFATHGGLSPDLITLNDINDIPRPSDVPIEGLLCDLLWSDPTKDSQVWMPSDRGVSYCFGEQVVDAFLKAFDVDIIVRAHQVVAEGFEFFPPGTRKLVTVFSAVNYCNQFDNAGAMMLVDSDLVCSFHVLKPEAKEEEIDTGRSNSFTRPQTPRPD
mmetsp:Transcript_18877/g.37090  ORF Transcript_18877/g.37090 Transcript_18877/m.37090 type:complete len:386 (+) Transcript_18877:336-1493(+)|eukprot:CAMPEP_0171529520 /NCGR_PEP_ID=MMETSP0959-20130129/12414_1 /TAXON_ID=87120 /ORGANISM="Aurantiochytrium limacinum, Strain ATCCMYA-1381" /LENGTH=385 /DNA_ID=CAMNT_0012071903 /DNA_START=253 /DNA_END=1410 /DNA_ORIENTATION=+